MDRFEIARNWLRTCSQTHDSCNSSARENLPTRLVSVRDGKARLIITAELDTDFKSLRYATLSYCWGRGEFLRLGIENLETFKKCIPVDVIPKTFRDAFEIIRALEIEFIWIDALCIIQNDPKDWEREADLMQSVYGHSHINIAASSGKDVHAGCFLRQARVNDGLRVKVTMNGKPKIKQFRDDSVFLYEQSVASTHLMTRGWVLQEKVLSPRTIHFDNRGVAWECRENVAIESLPGGLQGIHDRFDQSWLVFRNNMKTGQSWADIIGRFSETNLTCRDDKLPALSGIARKWQNVTGDQYFAGLWRTNMGAQLCWSVGNVKMAGKQLHRGHVDWVAPSWSWLSVDVPVYPGAGPAEGLHYFPDKHSHVHKVDMTYKGPKPFGRISHGILRVSCSGLVPGRFCGKQERHRGLKEIRESFGVITKNSSTIFLVTVDYVRDWYDTSEEVYLLPLAEYYSGMIQGIVIRKTNKSVGEFFRIGRFDFYGDFGATAYPKFLEVFNEIGEQTARSVCAEEITNTEHPEEKYVINIV